MNPKLKHKMDKLQFEIDVMEREKADRDKFNALKKRHSELRGGAAGSQFWGKAGSVLAKGGKKAADWLTIKGQNLQKRREKQGPVDYWKAFGL